MIIEWCAVLSTLCLLLITFFFVWALFLCVKAGKKIVALLSILQQDITSFSAGSGEVFQYIKKFFQLNFLPEENVPSYPLALRKFRMLEGGSSNIKDKILQVIDLVVSGIILIKKFKEE